MIVDEIAVVYLKYSIPLLLDGLVIKSMLLIFYHTRVLCWL